MTPSRSRPTSRGPLVAALALLVALALACFAPPATANPESQEELRKKIKEQMEKILRLMKENETALLKLSTGKRAEPVEVDVEVEPPAEQEGSGGEGGDESGEPSNGEAGREAEAGMRELIRKQRGEQGRIPTELEELVRMVPMQQGSGQGSGDPSAADQPKPQPRDQEKELGEGEKEETEGGEEPRNPRDPRDRTDQTGEDSPEGEGGGRDRNADAWDAVLPPQLREAWDRGDFTRVPAEYRDLVERYMIWLRKEARKLEEAAGNR